MCNEHDKLKITKGRGNARNSKSAKWRKGTKETSRKAERGTWIEIVLLRVNGGLVFTPHTWETEKLPLARLVSTRERETKGDTWFDMYFLLREGERFPDCRIKGHRVRKVLARKSNCTYFLQFTRGRSYTYTLYLVLSSIRARNFLHFREERESEKRTKRQRPFSLSLFTPFSSRPRVFLLFLSAQLSRKFLGVARRRVL